MGSDPKMAISKRVHEILFISKKSNLNIPIDKKKQKKVG